MIEKEIQHIDSLIYQSETGAIELRSDGLSETIYATLQQVADLFSIDKSGVSRHIKNIFVSGELDKKSVVAKIATTASDGKIYQVDYYNLDVIISV
ncbi:MAG: cell filamentation protein Fic [Patescibacteria group bacterium]|nr:cell filamentation protein Fic [Patescibacteria group bacterium]